MNPLLKAVIGESYPEVGDRSPMYPEYSKDDPQPALDNDPSSFELNQEQYNNAMRHIHDRYVKERTQGYIHPTTGQQVPGVGREEAEAQWAQAKPKFEAALRNPKAEAGAKLGLWRPRTQPQDAWKSRAKERPLARTAAQNFKARGSRSAPDYLEQERDIARKAAGNFRKQESAQSIVSSMLNT